MQGAALSESRWAIKLLCLSLLCQHVDESPLWQISER